MNANAVASPHHLSAEAGRRIIETGGNAVDAAVAVVVAQGVVAPETCGLGGDLFALVHRPGWDRPRTLNASGHAGSGADASDLRRYGLDHIPRDHSAAVTIPGCVDGLITLVRDHGSLGIGAVIEPGLELAREGFTVSTEQEMAFARQADIYGANPAVAEFYPQGTAVTAGDHVRRPALARTLEDIVVGGREGFYGGRPGEDIVAAVEGLIKPDDLMSSQAEWVDPIGVEVVGFTAWTTPPNSQGYLGPATLAVFEMLDPPHDPSDPMWWHLLIEAYRSLAWERNDIVSDFDTLALPAGMLMARDRLGGVAATVNRDEAGVWPTPMGSPSGTAYMCVADSDGLAVSIIQSNFHGTGSTRGAARSGFLLQDRGRGFSLTPGHPNELGPGRRPLHTLSPTLWTDGDRARWVIGTRGGDVQPQLVSQLAARTVLSGWDLDDAQRAPRWTVTDFGPSSYPNLVLEPGTPDGVVSRLEGLGHRVETRQTLQPGWGPMSIIELDGDERRAAADPRVDTATALVF